MINLEKKIQCRNINSDLTKIQLVEHLETCLEFKFDAAMISPCWIPLAKKILKGSGIKVATTVNFPHATDSKEMKATVIPYIAEMGADEFDFPPNPGFLLSDMYEEYEEEISLIVETAHKFNLKVKAMLEFGYLKEEKKRIAAIELACRAGVDWIKNSSGWGLGGSPATVEDIELLVRYCILPCKVKASGKINSLKKANLLLEAGAEMLGTSSAREIMLGSKGNEDNY